jgi:hypothetical protein
MKLNLKERIIMKKVKEFWDEHKDEIIVIAEFATFGAGIALLSYTGCKAGFYKAFKSWTINPVVVYKPTKSN